MPELDNRLGDYDVCEIIGMGQFSTVKRGVRRSAPQCTERQGDKGQDRALMGAAIDADGMGAGAGTRAAQPVQVFGSGSNRLACTTCLAGSPFSGIADISSGDEAPVGTAVALKFLQKEKMTSIDTAIRVEAEIGALKALAGHANVVRYYTTVHARAAVCIVTELLQTDLFDFLARSKDKVSVPVAACIARELLEALCHLQEHCIAHRDVKVRGQGQYAYSSAQYIPSYVCLHTHKRHVRAPLMKVLDEMLSDRTSIPLSLSMACFLSHPPPKARKHPARRVPQYADRQALRLQPLLPAA